MGEAENAETQEVWTRPPNQMEEQANFDLARDRLSQWRTINAAPTSVSRDL
jgi:hypothetical protein